MKKMYNLMIIAVLLLGSCKTTPTLGKRAKNPQPIRVGFLVNGGGAESCAKPQ
jgi:hypothetical protein